MALIAFATAEDASTSFKDEEISRTFHKKVKTKNFAEEFMK